MLTWSSFRIKSQVGKEYTMIVSSLNDSENGVVLYGGRPHDSGSSSEEYEGQERLLPPRHLSISISIRTLDPSLSYGRLRLPRLPPSPWPVSSVDTGALPQALPGGIVFTERVRGHENTNPKGCDYPRQNEGEPWAFTFKYKLSKNKELGCDKDSGNCPHKKTSQETFGYVAMNKCGYRSSDHDQIQRSGYIDVGCGEFLWAAWKLGGGDGDGDEDESENGHQDSNAIGSRLDADDVPRDT
ncbi:hypothetical protein MKZ38_002150 [Zalerion maritima]|uniref:Uncharacterized protein n=1 Tax=Zalerion maritima TaxID=339359 RepID=A0AAD5RPF8_9PEZI|nr:hypothetical protein MKZ38_002150 [Zalerion maritima]